ncbi:MAG TPA: hypothetical protein VL463_16070 [Kofleriaceae bacterium]|nr:hypothetical protein [Kofleriaceae bacterium]
MPDDKQKDRFPRSKPEEHQPDERERERMGRADTERPDDKPAPRRNRPAPD